MEESVSNIIKGLWISGEGGASSKQFFDKEDIRACMNCTPSIQNNFSFHGVEYLRLPVNDSTDKEDIEMVKEVMPLAVEWLRVHHKLLGHSVLVQCHQGINRSATFVCAYLMKHWGMKLKDAIDFLILRRQAIFYNGDKPTFKKVLEEWEKSLQS